jgi:proline iminopeptidase
MLPNFDARGYYSYYDYTRFPLKRYELEARAIPTLPAGNANVSDHHRIHYWVAGGDKGLRALREGEKQAWFYVHGGPGGGFTEDDHRLVDPENLVPVMMVQRGAAGSSFEGVMQDVSVDHLVSDFLDVLNSIGIEKAHWSGGSWGTTLVLKLLLEHPEIFFELPTLRGLWIPSTTDLQFGYSRLNKGFPHALDEQAKFFGFISEQQAILEEAGLWESAKLTEGNSLPFVAYHYFINGEHGNNELRLEAARRLWRWELISAKANPSEEDLKKIAIEAADEVKALGFAATICHFCINNFFLQLGEDFTDSELWQRRGEIESMGLGVGALVHGAEDSLCRPLIAQAWAASTPYKLYLIPGAGHSRSEFGIRAALITVLNSLD